jgi:hypothetical protein
LIFLEHFRSAFFQREKKDRTRQTKRDSYSYGLAAGTQTLPQYYYPTSTLHIQGSCRNQGTKRKRCSQPKRPARASRKRARVIKFFLSSRSLHTQKRSFLALRRRYRSGKSPTPTYPGQDSAVHRFCKVTETGFRSATHTRYCPANLASTWDYLFGFRFKEEREPEREPETETERQMR